MAQEIAAQVGPQVYADGVVQPPRMDRQGALNVSELHGRYYEQAFRRNIFWAANQAATAWSVALATTYTGIVLSNPPNSGVNLAVLQAGFVLSVAPAAIASIGLFCGYLVTGITAHTTPLTPFSNFIGGPKGAGLADAAATLVDTPRWSHHIMGGFTAAALPATSPAIIDLGGIFILPPGAYLGIGSLTAVTGLGSLLWEEIPI